MRVEAEEGGGFGSGGVEGWGENAATVIRVDGSTGKPSVAIC